jgi:hypothetical protein
MDSRELSAPISGGVVVVRELLGTLRVAVRRRRLLTK